MERLRTKDEDLKLWHRIFFNNICSQIAAKEQELEKYNALKTKVISLKGDLESCELNVKNTYNYAQSGIVCEDFSTGINAIDGYVVKIKNLNAKLEGLIQEIDKEIKRIQDEIAALKIKLNIKVDI